MNSTKKTSVFANALIWFGAGVSIAEILTGTYYSTLGFGKGLAAILIGHLIGGVMMFAAGLIGGLEEKSAMETVKMSFGEKGSLLFVLLNVLQLVGWTAIMIDRRTDHRMDPDRSYQSRKGQYGRNGSPPHPVPDSVLCDLPRRQRC